MAFLVGALASVAPLWQSQRQFEDSIRLANELHFEGLKLAEENHREEQQLEAALHKASMALDRELHYGEMSHAVDIARREAVRDVYSQKYQLLQTLMIVNTLMLQVSACVFAEGDPPQGTSVHWVRLLAALIGIAMGTLVVSVYVLIIVQKRMSQFDMHRPQRQYSCGHRHADFNEFYRCHCEHLEQCSVLTLGVGTAAAIAAGAIALGSGLYYQTAAISAAWIFAGLCVAGSVLALAGIMPFAGRAEEDEADFGGLGQEDLTVKAPRESATGTTATDSIMMPSAFDDASPSSPTAGG